MANYTVDANWTAKDSAASGSADKVIRAVEFQTEFDLIATAIASKFDSTTAVDINSGAIDNTTIGSATPSSGTFTNLTATATVTLASPILNTAVSGTAVLDEDDMASNSDTKLATQQSIKAYVDSNTEGRWVETIINSFYNYSFGLAALDANLSGENNIAVGVGVLSDNITGSENVAIGNSALRYCYSDDNTAVGYKVLYNATSGNNNTAFGHLAGESVTSASRNVIVGADAFKTEDISSDNVAVGFGAMAEFDSALSQGANVAIGTYAMQYTESDYNVAIGFQTLQGDSTGFVTGNSNTAVGANALKATTTGSGNTGVGRATAWTLTTGDNNTCIGYLAGAAIIAGDNNTCLGYNSQPAGANANNSITLGDANIVALRCNTTSITSLSDVRDKTNIADLTACSTFVKQLEPVSFDWARRDGSMQGHVGHGFIAQQLKAVQETTGYSVPGLVSEDNPDKLEAAYGAMLPTVIGALKEALIEIDELKAKVAALENA